MLKNKLLALLLGAVLLFGCSGVKLDLPAAVQPDPTPAPTAAPTPEPTPKPTPKPTAKPTAAPSPEPAEEPAAQSETVWLSRTGETYHCDPNCGNMKNPIKSTLDEAIASGREPCKKCYG